MIYLSTRSFRGHQIEVLINDLIDDGDKVAANLSQVVEAAKATGASVVEIVNALNAPLIELKTPLEKAVERQVYPVSVDDVKRFELEEVHRG